MDRVQHNVSIGPVMIASAVLALSGCFSGGPARIPLILTPTTGTGGGSATDSAALRAQAESLVLLNFSLAALVEVIGTPSSGAADTAADVNRFEFRFAVSRLDPTAGAAWVDSTDGRFGPIQTTSMIVSDAVSAELPNSTSLEQAVALMRKAGFTDPFRRVIFRRLAGGTAAEATYAFDLNGRFVLVGAVSNAVTETTFQPEPVTLVPNL